MKVIKSILTLILILTLLVTSVIVYAFKLEPYQLKVVNFTLSSEISNSNSLKIVQFSDTHVKDDFTIKNLSKVVEAINNEAADIVIFSGDLYDNFSQYKDNDNVINELAKIDANHKIAIRGNRDIGGGASRIYADLMEASGFELLINEHKEIQLNNSLILISAIDDSLLGNPSLIPNNHEYDYRIFLTHEPDSVDKYADHYYDLALAAHTHGGQFNIPLLPSINETALDVSSLASNYSSGLYQLENSNIKQIYVNTGIGTTHISARLGVKPIILSLEIQY